LGKKRGGTPAPGNRVRGRKGRQLRKRWGHEGGVRKTKELREGQRFGPCKEKKKPGEGKFFKQTGISQTGGKNPKMLSSRETNLKLKEDGKRGLP